MAAPTNQPTGQDIFNTVEGAVGSIFDKLGEVVGAKRNDDGSTTVETTTGNYSAGPGPNGTVVLKPKPWESPIVIGLAALALVLILRK